MSLSSVSAICYAPHRRGLTHCGLVMPYDIVELGQLWFKKWLVAWLVPIHHLNQCWLIISCALRNKFLWNIIQNVMIFIQENALKNVSQLV